MRGGPTALLFASDFGAWAALRWLAAPGIRVPQDVSVAGYNDDAPSRHLIPALSSVSIPLAEIAGRFLDFASKPTGLPCTVTFTPGLVPRESTGIFPGAGPRGK